MSVIYLNRNRLSDGDVSAVTALSYKLCEKGTMGGCVPFEMDDGGRIATILDSDHQNIALAFGRNRCGYYAVDSEGRIIAEECQSIEEIIRLL